MKGWKPSRLVVHGSKPKKPTYVRPYRVSLKPSSGTPSNLQMSNIYPTNVSLLNYGWLSPPQKVGIFGRISKIFHHTPSFLSTGILWRPHTKTKLALKASFPCDAGLDQDRRTNRNPICFWYVVLAIRKRMAPTFKPVIYANISTYLWTSLFTSREALCYEMVTFKVELSD